MIIASIGLVCVAADRAFRLAEHAAPPSADRPLPDTMADADLASDLLTACLSSFPLVLIGVAVFKVVTADFGFAAEAPLVFAIKVVGQSATAAVPLVAAAFAALWLWGSGRKYRIDVGADLVSIRVD